MSDERSLESGIVSQNVLLTGLSGLSGDLLLDGVPVGAGASLQSLSVSREIGDSGISDLSGESLEIRSGGDKVSLAAKADDDGLVTISADKDSTLGSLTVSPLGSHKFTFLADDLDSLLEIAVSLIKGVLAIHHSSGGHLPQFHNVLCGNSHKSFFFNYSALGSAGASSGSATGAASAVTSTGLALLRARSFLPVGLARASPSAVSSAASLSFSSLRSLRPSSMAWQRIFMTSSIDFVASSLAGIT